MSTSLSREDWKSDLFPEGLPKLWCPLLTHYRLEAGRARVDTNRMATHVRALRPFVRGFLIAGSTGDGWDIDESQFSQLLTFSRRREVFGAEPRVVIGALRPTTQEVLRFASMIARAAGTDPGSDDGTVLKALGSLGWAGVVVCPPVGRHTTQAAILDHYGQAARLRLPLAAYQLPQVTQCSMTERTLALLAARLPGLYLFKDSSGQDRVARSGRDFAGIVLVRGAEGDYAESLKPMKGLYDGLLVSTANVFVRELYRIVELVHARQLALARAASRQLGARVKRIFAAVASVPVGNPFANANRAVDHILAHGPRWRQADPPVLFDGSRLPGEPIAAVATILEETGAMPTRPYL